MIMNDLSLSEIVDYLVEWRSQEFTGENTLSFPRFDFHFDPMDPDLIVNAAKSMNECGCVILRNFMPSNEANVLADEIFDFINSVKNKVGVVEEDIEEDGYILCGKKTKYKPGDDLIGAGKPTVMTFENYDEGMVKIFNADHLFTKNKEIIDLYGRHQFILEILAACNVPGAQFKHGHLDIYANQSDELSTGFHYDTDVPMVKTFLYLTDVLSVNDGPYCYAAGTHNETNIRKFNQEINKISNRGDLVCFHFNKDRVIPFLGKKGDLILSFQNGAHQRHNQKKGHQRMMLVGNLWQNN